MSGRFRPPRPVALRTLRPDRVTQPLIEFSRTEASGGIVLLAAAIVALVWANSPWDASYRDLWATELSLDLGFIDFSDDLHHWVNEGLMTVFFFVVGLEVKRELVLGELNTRRKALMPAAAALGGMVTPAAIYLAFNAGGEAQRGWGIPMATDIAFAVGVLALLGPRIAPSLRAFLLALAIIDDIGAISVIAVFYTDDFAVGPFAAAISFVVAVVVVQRIGVRPLAVYAALGLCLWAAMVESGVHATIAGVVLGLLTPTAPLLSVGRFEAALRELTGRVADADREPDPVLAADERRAALYSLERLSRESESPLERLEHGLHPWVSFGVVPIFALANAGVALSFDSVGGAFEADLGRGVALGLLLGKPAGVMLFTWLAVRAGLGELGDGMRWPALAGLSILTAIGFTVALFIAELAFDDAARIEEAKIAILAASVVAGAVGYAALRLLTATEGRVTPPGRRG
jgi:NhaA family Na+:H+ antiporter